MERLGDLTRELKQAATGRLAARYIRSLAATGGNAEAAADFAASRRWVEATTLKSAISASTRADWSGVLASVGQDLGAVVRPRTVIGRLRGFRRVPAAIACITQTAAATAYWVDAGGPTPLSALAFSRDALFGIRLAAMAVVTEELARSSDPAADDAILRDLTGAIVQKMDETFLDPTNAGSPEVLPKSITHETQQFLSSGSDVASIDGDLRLMLNALSDGGSDLQSAVWILNPRSAAFLAGLRGSGGSLCYPSMGVRSGELLGLPALVSGSVLRTGSPQETFICLVDPTRIWLSESGDIELSVSGAATLEMESVPTNNSATPTPTNHVSMWQTQSLAAKAVQSINWRAMTAVSAATCLTGVGF